MAQHRAVSAAQDDGEDAALGPQLRVAEGVDAALDADQSLRANAVVNRLDAETQAQELPPRHDAVLASRQPPNRFIDRTWTSHVEV
jgi:hypothetical protein